VPRSPGSAGPPAAAGGPTARAGTGTPRAEIGDDLTRWQYWWEWNKDPYLRLKEAVRAGKVVEGSDEAFFAARHDTTADALRPTEDEVLQQIAPALEEALERETQRDIASGCLVALGKIARSYPDYDVVPRVLPHLRSHDQEIRETAALVLGIADRPAAATLLLALVRDDALGRELCGRSSVDERTRSFACYGLGLLGRSAPLSLQHNVVSALLAVLRQDDLGRDLRVAAINALRVCGSGPEHSPGRDVLREGAVRELWEYYRGEQRPGHQVLRAHALPAIAALVGRRSGDAAGAHKAALLAELTAHPRREAEVTQAAALALGMLCAPREADPADARYSDALRATFAGSLDHQTRYFCLMALGAIGGRSNLDFLLTTLNEGTKALVKPWAATALGELAFRAEGPDAKPTRERIAGALRRELDRVRNDETRAAAAIGLGLCGDRDSAAALRDALREEGQRDELAGYLCVALALMDARAAIPDLRAVVERASRRPELLRQAAIALGKLGDKDAVPLLVGMLHDEEPSFSKLSSVSVALGLIGDRRSIAPLVALLRDREEPDVSRAFAAVALGGIADSSPLPWGTDIAVGVNYRAAVSTLTDGVAGVLDIL
jgi:hypothetical protein